MIIKLISIGSFSITEKVGYVYEENSEVLGCIFALC